MTSLSSTIHLFTSNSSFCKPSILLCYIRVFFPIEMHTLTQNVTLNVYLIQHRVFGMPGVNCDGLIIVSFRFSLHKFGYTYAINGYTHQLRKLVATYFSVCMEIK